MYSEKATTIPCSISLAKSSKGGLAETDQGEFRIATDDLPRGFYYLHITDAFQENTWTGSFIKN